MHFFRFTLALSDCISLSALAAPGRDYQFAVDADSSPSLNGERAGSEIGMRNTMLVSLQFA